MSEGKDTTKQDTIGTNILRLDVPNGFFSKKRFRIIDSRELLRSLHVIREKAVEEHTRNNLQKLIDQIYESRPNV